MCNYFLPVTFFLWFYYNCLSEYKSGVAMTVLIRTRLISCVSIQFKFFVCVCDSSLCLFVFCMYVCLFVMPCTMKGGCSICKHQSIVSACAVATVGLPMLVGEPSVLPHDGQCYNNECTVHSLSLSLVLNVTSLLLTDSEETI